MRFAISNSFFGLKSKKWILRLIATTFRPFYRASLLRSEAPSNKSTSFAWFCPLNRTVLEIYSSFGASSQSTECRCTVGKLLNFGFGNFFLFFFSSITRTTRSRNSRQRILQHGQRIFLASPRAVIYKLITGNTPGRYQRTCGVIRENSTERISPLDRERKRERERVSCN